MFERACERRGHGISRIPNGCKSVGPRKLIRVKSPFDWIISSVTTTYFIDTKTQKGGAFPFSKIDPHQVEELLKHDRPGRVAGYIIWFRARDVVCFVPVKVLRDSMTRRGSFSTDHPGVTIIGDSLTMDLSWLRRYASTQDVSSRVGSPTESSSPQAGPSA
jgi:penicillin-binding protein-related factor A (putative recombinase)